ncbi:DUF4169 family protein [Devosia nitrariae]|uniref:DUF4169 family protein n=1 Tax=Devosia nitrariae TaxID=2071872 RepID=A0ABQ5WE54_9HYPH|nr:DUF4169 family protein [Devosia nitrariae]GLQ57790.1 hypothetical protein GCM10010862_50490 [Devosia nitrariae]
MADIVNLRRARKQKARSEKEVTAAENRVRFGRTKAEREREEAQKTLANKRIEAHKRDE